MFFIQHEKYDVKRSWIICQAFIVSGRVGIWIQLWLLTPIKSLNRALQLEPIIPTEACGWCSWSDQKCEFEHPGPTFNPDWCLLARHVKYSDRGLQNVVALLQSNFISLLFWCKFGDSLLMSFEMDSPRFCLLLKLLKFEMGNMLS